MSNALTTAEYEENCKLLLRQQSKELSEDVLHVMQAITEIINVNASAALPPPPEGIAKLYHHGVNVHDEDRTTEQNEAIMKAMIPGECSHPERNTTGGY